MKNPIRILQSRKLVFLSKKILQSISAIDNHVIHLPFVVNRGSAVLPHRRARVCRDIIKVTRTCNTVVASNALPDHPIHFHSITNIPPRRCHLSLKYKLLRSARSKENFILNGFFTLKLRLDFRRS